jgi:hypothetical protein
MNKIIAMGTLLLMTCFAVVHNRPLPEPAKDHCFKPLTIKKGK